MPTSTVRRSLNAVRHSQKALESHERNLALAMVIAMESGATADEVAEVIGCDRATVYRRIKRAGLVVGGA